MRLRLLDVADTLCHKVCDPYINAMPFGHHTPGWGLLQLWQHYLCDAYENALEKDTMWGRDE